MGSKVILFNMISLDGFFEGPGHDISWHNVDEEFNEFAIEQLNAVDTILFGRVTYEMMAAYWPTVAAASNDPVITEKMNTMHKIVFSRTLSVAGWNNTKLIKENIAEVVMKLKQSRQRQAKDLIIFGSANLASTFIQQGLIDEYRIIVNPLVLGSGEPLFKNIQDKLNLKLLQTKTFRSGNVLLYYQPVQPAY